MIASIDQVGQKLIGYLSLTESALTTLVQRRPSFDLDLSEAAQETPGIAALPFRCTNVVTAYQDALRGRFADQVGDVHPPTDQIADQPLLAVNMLHVGRHPRASLQTILEEDPDSKS